MRKIDNYRHFLFVSGSLISIDYQNYLSYLDAAFCAILSQKHLLMHSQLFYLLLIKCSFEAIPAKAYKSDSMRWLVPMQMYLKKRTYIGLKVIRLDVNRI